MSSGDAIHILYADDDSDDIELVRGYFAEYKPHIKLTTFPDGFDLVRHLYQYPEGMALPSLIIVDMNMPKFDGKITIEVIKDQSRLKDIPLVIFTTSSDSGDKKFAHDNNVGFISKPISEHQMHSITESFLNYCSDTI